MDPALLLFLVLLGWASKSAWQHVMQSYRADRDAKIEQAQQNTPPKGLSAAQKKRVAAHHAAGWWTREVLGGFPVARTGWQAGWLAHKLHALQNRNARSEARRLHRDLRNQQDAAMVTGGAEPQEPEQPAQHPEPQPAVRALRLVPGPPGDTPEPGPYVNGNGSKPPQLQGDAVPTGTTAIPEVTYNQLISEGRRTIAACEVREVQLIVEAQWARYADSLSGALRDGSTLGNLADVADSVDQELKDVRHTKEMAEHFISQLQREHGGMADAHQSAPVRGAQPEFYED